VERLCGDGVESKPYFDDDTEGKHTPICRPKARGSDPSAWTMHGRVCPPFDTRGGPINYHPQSGWLEEAPLKEGTVGGDPPAGASGRLDPPGHVLSVVAGLRYHRAPVARRAVLGAPDSGWTVR
jgi:hypothetical protein